MIGRLLLVFVLASSAALAQLQLYLIKAPGSEQPVNGQIDVGSVPSGDIHDTKLRIRNLGDTEVLLERFRVQGEGFTIEGNPTTPYKVAPGTNVDFRVRFRPLNFGSYSANLRINDNTTFITGSSPKSITLSAKENGEFQLLSSGDTTLFGSVELPSNAARRFRLDNPANTQLSVSNLSVGTGMFKLVDLSPAPFALDPGESLEFTVTYNPLMAGIHQSELILNQRTFQLEGVGVDPPYPEPEILLETQALESGAQGSISVRLPSPSIATGTGELRMKFQPSIDWAADDPAIQFLASGSKVIPLKVFKGETYTHLGNEETAVFQTGTTAGTITFTVKLGTHKIQASGTMLPSPVVMDSSSLKRTATGLELNIAGFDNSQSTSEIAFTFYDKSGRALTSAPIKADVSVAFSHFFLTTKLGGLFSLTAAFPVAGDSSQIGAVDVQFTSGAGISAKQRINF